MLHAILRLEAQLRSNQLAFEQNTLEARREANRSAEALSNGLQTIEKSLAAQQEAFAIQSARELEMMHKANRTILIGAGSFAAMACLAMLLVACFQWRMSRVWAGISASLPMPTRLGVSALGSGAVQDANGRLLGAMEQLEKRVQGLEETSGTSAQSEAQTFLEDNGDSPAGNGDDSASGTKQSAVPQRGQIRALLRRGQSMLKENQPEAAISCFDEVLSMNPNHPEALVKKGAALERLHKLNEAFECYDRAITLDGSMTMAYLYKGGLCSRLERFKEALECYEKALQTHDQGQG